MKQPTTQAPGQEPTTSLDNVQRRRRGLAWLAFGFAICPCHLPFTLLAVGAIFGGTAIGATITGNPVAVGVVLGVVTVLAYRKGLQLLREPGTCSTGACSTASPVADQETGVLTRR